jgi:hypothetical protein
MINTVGIIGYGNFGKFVHELGQRFFPNLEFRIHSRRADVDNETFFDLKSRLCWVCKRAVTASRSEKIKSLSAGGLGWQVLRVSGRQDGGGSSSRNRRWMNGEGLS